MKEYTGMKKHYITDHSDLDIIDVWPGDRVILLEPVSCRRLATFEADGLGGLRRVSQPRHALVIDAETA